MNFKRVRKTLSIVAAGAALAFGMNSAYAGKIFISGHDSDDGGHVTQAFGAQMLDFIGSGNTNGGSGILVLGGYTGTSASNINNWNSVALETLTASSGAGAIAAQSFAGFAAIFMPSASSQTGGGITQAELNAINLRSADIVAFVNGGGNLMAFTQQGLTGAFGWFPLGALATSSIGSLDISQTPELALAGFTATNAEIAGDLYHNEFTGPAGFFGLKVLAVNNNTQQAVILGGGVGTKIGQVPEPTTLSLFGAALLASLAWSRRKPRATRKG